VALSRLPQAQPEDLLRTPTPLWRCFRRIALLHQIRRHSQRLLEAASKDANSRMKGDADGDNVLSCLEAYSYAKTALESSGYDFLPHISGGLRDFALIDNRGN